MKAKEAQSLALSKMYSDQEERYKLNEKFILEEIRKIANNKGFTCQISIDTTKVTLPTILRLVAYFKELEYEVSFTEINSRSNMRILTLTWPGKPNDKTWYEEYMGCLVFSIFILVIILIVTITIILINIFN